MTVTPVTNWPTVWRNARRSNADHQRFESNALVVPEVVPLVQLVPSPEFRSDRVPQKFEQFDALLRGIAAGPADELLEVRLQRGHLEIECARRQVNQRARQRVLD